MGSWGARGASSLLRCFFCLLHCATPRRWLDKQQPRSQGLSSSRRDTLVWAGHVSMYTNEIPIGGGSLT